MSYDAAYAKRWRLDHERGITRVVSAPEAASHVWALLGAGWSLRGIAGAAGVSANTVIRMRDQKRVTRKCVAKVLAVHGLPCDPSNQVTEPFVPRIGTVRRIQAMLFMGWTHAHLQARCGLRTHLLLTQPGRWVTRTTHDKIAALYDEIGMTPGPSEITRRRARKAGYVGPLSWDDIDHDTEPVVDVEDSGLIDEAAILRRMAGDKSVPLTQTERVEAVRRWFDQGGGWNEGERVMGINIEVYRTREGEAS
jgi:hypothetical protein